MNVFDILQLTGGLLLTVAYIPQIAQIIRTRSVRDLNLRTFIVSFIGIGLMQIYALDLWRTKGTPTFFVTNALALAVAFVMLALIVVYRKRRDGFSGDACSNGNAVRS